MAGVRPWPAQVTRDEAAQLRGAQPAVPEDAQQRVIALADLAATVRDAQQVLVVGVGDRLRRPGLVARHLDARGRVLAAELARQGADHGEIDPPRGQRRGSPPATARRLQVAGVGGDHVPVEVTDHRGSAELAA